MSVAVVTDSTACLPSAVLPHPNITVVPLPVTINGVSGSEGVDVTPADIVKAFELRRIELSTSRPAPGELFEVYKSLFDRGFSGIVSIHLSTKLSGTCEAAQLAAREFGDRVQVVDSANAGMGMGFCVLAARDAAASGASIGTVADVAKHARTATQTFFYVDTLEFLRRGGRISAASALLGTALSVKPILHVDSGRVMLRDKVRTSTRALSRLEDLVLEAGQDQHVDVAVHHLQAPERAKELAERLALKFGDRIHQTHISEVGAVVAAHCGPGLLGAVVHRRD